MQNPIEFWNEIIAKDVSVKEIESFLSIVLDDHWVVAACADTSIDAIDVQRRLLEIGLERSLDAVTRCKTFSSSSSEDFSSKSPLPEHFQSSPIDAEICILRSILLARLDRLVVYEKMVQILRETSGIDDSPDIEDDPWEDDPWDDAPQPTSPPPITLPFPLSHFLAGGLLETTLTLASMSLLRPLEVLFHHYIDVLWPYRFSILDSVPQVTEPSDFTFILPSLNSSFVAEQRPPFNPIRPEAEWVETSHVRASLDIACSHSEKLHLPPLITTASISNTPEPLSHSALEVWYRRRVDRIINETGLVDLALSLVQYGAAQGMPALDSLGEDLSLFSRLVYEENHEEAVVADDWTWDQWQSFTPTSVLQAYLKHSTPTSLPSDMKRLVMPYLYVLESKAERAGTPDPTLHQKLLHEYILQSPLERIVGIFDSSKPTLPSAQRIVSDDEEMACLALSCLYGSNVLDQWTAMGLIFECLPDWNIDNEKGDSPSDELISSLATFLSSQTTSSLMPFFSALSQPSLSRFLDLLDVHLESAEILSRWEVPVPLNWPIVTHNKPAEQLAMANRMTRRVSSSGHTSREDWGTLLDDMLKLCTTNESGLSGAFGLLPKQEITKVFFSGLLSSGGFDVARHMLQHTPTLQLAPEVVEELCLSSSRELYDNASIGHYTFGEMKLAYDCLSVPPLTPTIAKEKDFIEATSRISSFNVYSRPGILISPIEIRLTKDKLSLVSQVLSSNSDAYKHSEVILDLVNKLGFRDDVLATVKALAMLTETALQMEDFNMAYKHGLRMIQTVEDLRQSHPPTDSILQNVQLVCWISCYQLGRQTEFQDVEKKLLFLGFALQICPADRIHEVLAHWRKAEEQHLEHAPQKVLAESQPKSLSNLTGNLSLRSRLHHFHMPSPPLLNTPDAAALATKTFKSVASNFSFPGSRRSLDDDSALSFRSEEVSAQASRALSKGIGWLIGTDEQE